MPTEGRAASDESRISIINGTVTRISDWPWQVALAFVPPGRKLPTRNRYFCSGSLIAPDLVITAAHCVASFAPKQVRRIEVIAGRTRLNSDAGTSTRVRHIHFPLDRRGKRRYNDRRGSAAWDVALLKLKRDLPGTPIKLAGPTETEAWQPGRKVKTTGWGVTRSNSSLASTSLRLATQVMLPDELCRRDNGPGYRSDVMVCLGGPAGNSSTCFGDSGGPLVARTSNGWRLVGLTSFGDLACRTNVASIDTRVAGQAIRGWVRRTALELSRVNPVGSGGQVGARPAWCRVPKLAGRNLAQARQALRTNGCLLGRTAKDRYSFIRKGRISDSFLPPGWLAPPGTRVGVWVRR